MQASMFNVRVPLPDRQETFLMNTLTDAQVIVSDDVIDLLDRVNMLAPDAELSEDQRAALAELSSNGFIVESREADRRAVEQFLREFREDTREMRLTVLTTLQCNFACSYCFQGDHGAFNQPEHKMSLETARRLVAWTEARLDELGPEKLSVLFFGGEPLLNLPVMYYLAEQLWNATQARGISMTTGVVTNGLLLTPDVVDRLQPYGLDGIKITLDGDRDTHDRMRPLRGGQPTFDKIVDNVRRVAGRVRIGIGGNFSESSVDSFPTLLDFLKAQEFADKLVDVHFKPIVGEKKPATPKNGLIPLTPVAANGKPLGGTCMTMAGSGGGSLCQNCHFAAEKTAFLREETRRRGFPTDDGVHEGPCELHHKHAYAVGPDGSLYACPGFAAEAQLAVGDIDGRRDPWREESARKFDVLAPWKSCGDCSFIPVCAGGCSAASYNDVGDYNAPLCFKENLELGLVTLAHQVAAASA